MKQFPFVCSVFFLSSCSLFPQNQKPFPRKLSEVRPVAEFTATIERKVSRQELLQALSYKEGTERLRLVPLQRSTSVEDPLAPEYRVFGVTAKSVYSLLGLENADILVAADDYLIHDPRTFPMYVSLLRDQSQAKIEIRRGNKALVLANQIEQ